MQNYVHDFAYHFRTEKQRLIVFEDRWESEACERFSRRSQRGNSTICGLREHIGINNLRSFLQTMEEMKSNDLRPLRTDWNQKNANDFANDLRDENQRFAAFGKGRESEDRRGLDQRQLRKYLRTMSLTKIVHYRMFI